MYPGIEQLRDIHGIQGVPWWPPGPGWWALAISLLAVTALAWRFRTSLRLRIPPLPVLTVGSWRWDAARKLRDLRRRAIKQDLKQTAGELSELLRRIAMARLGRDSCAGLTGSDWLEWLHGHDPNGFDWTQRGRVLLHAPYAPPGKAGAAEEIAALIDAAYDWVAAEDKKHV
ncbi:MAG: DUF4381 domain-containing protein [Chromatiaceae bacterium]